MCIYVVLFWLNNFLKTNKLLWLLLQISEHVLWYNHTMLFAVCGLFLFLSFFIKSFGAWIYALQVCCCSCITSCSSGPRFSTPPVFQLSQGMSEPYILYLHLYDCIGSLVPFKCAQTLKNTDCGPSSTELEPSLIEQRLCVCACMCVHSLLFRPKFATFFPSS